ncbi:MAG: hypothetical protein B7Z15_03740, partial [Rhizobiales bacterium 32-66-8]
MRTGSCADAARPALILLLLSVTLLTLTPAPAAAAPGGSPDPSSPCGRAPSPPAPDPVRVIDIRDGVVHLADGARLVPPGARMPSRLHPAPGLAEAAEQAARAALMGRRVEIVSPERDRYARYSGAARLLAEPHGTARPPARAEAPESADIGHLLVRVGAAYALPSALPPSVPAACAPALMAAEAEARAARRGLWAVPGALVSPTDAAGLAARAGLFTVAEGRLVRAKLTRDRLYLNFGHDWRVTLTATGNRRMAAMFSRDGLGPATLMGRV